jgi:S-DNA-T family DNA segregation ATPase FtsK/SpoIIIE
VLIAVLALALFIAVVAPGSAPVAKGVSDVVRLTIGFGAFILPFLLLVWAASFFIKQRLSTSIARLATGLALLFFATLAIIAVFTEGATGAGGNPDRIFAVETLRLHGGYLGGGIAWALLSAVGKGITLVLLIGLLIVGAVLIGFSITGLVDRIAGLFAKPDPSEQDILTGAYDLGTPAAAAGYQGLQRSRGKLIAPTTPLTGRLDAGAAATTRDLAPDFSEGDQARIPLEEADSLGATRRLSGRGKAGKRSTTVEGQQPQASADAVFPSASEFVLPDMNLLKVSRVKAATKAGESELRRTAQVLQTTLDEFGVEGKVVGWTAGPTVTLFKLKLGEGVRIARISTLADDIALALAAPAVRIFSPIPGTTLVGIEVPNVDRSFVLLGDVLPDSPPGFLQLAVGKDVEGDSIVADLAKMPHLLIGGTTGSGKSVAINTMIMSILMRATPAQVRMILIDPKMVELSLYNEIPHLYVPVVTDAQKAASALAWGVIEMERRLKLFKGAGSKNLVQYNEYVQKLHAEVAQKTTKTEQLAADAGSAETVPLGQKKPSDAPELPDPLPFIVIVIDELADLMMVAGKDVESSISRISQLARAAGLHLVIATQRPSTNVITGLIKANIVNRIAFSVASGIDSRVILDTPGAEKLIGDGDMLYSRPEFGKPARIQGAYISEREITTVVDFLKSQGAPEYHEDIFTTAVGGISMGTLSSDGGGGTDDPLLWEAADIVVSNKLATVSTLQRRLSVGFARAGRIMDMLEQKGIVGPPNGTKPREVMVDDLLELESIKALERSDSYEDW